MLNFEIEIASIPTREKLVAEIFYKNEQWVEISQEAGELLIQFYTPDNQDYWEFSFNDSMEALKQAKKKLLKVS